MFTPKLPFIVADVFLSEAQQEEFDRILTLYKDAYNYLLGVWLKYDAEKPINHIGTPDTVFIQGKLKSWWVLNRKANPDLMDVAEKAASDFLIRIKDVADGSVPMPGRGGYIATSLFYHKGHVIQPKEQTLVVPIIGRMRTGRFQFFDGSKKGFSLRRNVDKTFSVVLYYQPRQKDQLPTGIAEGSDEAKKFHLNKRLIAAKIGIMI